MTIQDIQYILAIMEAGSINKASEKLFVSQPSLSKCLKRVEQEYHIFLFTRSQGSALAITDIGRIFQTFAQEVLRSHDHLVNQIQILQHHRKNSIVLGTTMKRSYDLAGPLLRWIYINCPDYFVEIRTFRSDQLLHELADGSIDLALLSDMGENKEFHQTVVLTNHLLYIYLRSGSTASCHALKGNETTYPILSLEWLIDEPIATNKPGTGSRRMLDDLLRKNGFPQKIIEEPSLMNQIAMSNAGIASVILPNTSICQDDLFDQGRLFQLPSDQQVSQNVCLFCRPGFQRDRRHLLVCQAFQSIYETSKSAGI